MRKSKIKYVVAKNRVKLSVGDVIREACELNGMTQAELSKKSGINPPNLSDIVNGKRSIGRSVAEKLAEALNVSPAFILFAGEYPREGGDVKGSIDISLLKNTIQAMEDIKDENTHKQLTAMRMAIEQIAQVFILTSSPQNIAPIDLVANFARRANTHHKASIKRRR